MAVYRARMILSFSFFHFSPIVNVSCLGFVVCFRHPDCLLRQWDPRDCELSRARCVWNVEPNGKLHLRRHAGNIQRGCAHFQGSVHPPWNGWSVLCVLVSSKFPQRNFGCGAFLSECDMNSILCTPHSETCRVRKGPANIPTQGTGLRSHTSCRLCSCCCDLQELKPRDCRIYEAPWFWQGQPSGTVLRAKNLEQRPWPWFQVHDLARPHRQRRSGQYERKFSVMRKKRKKLVANQHTSQEIINEI